MSSIFQNLTLSTIPSEPSSSHYLTNLVETGISLQKDLSWQNVLIAFAFISFNGIVSWMLEIGIGTSLLISAVRCIVQLTLVATILQQVFAAENKWVVAAITVLLNLLGTMEIVVNKVKRRYEYMLPSVLIAMLGSTIPIAVIGTRYAMAVDPFWEPMQFIPIVGMLCGATISGITVSINYLLKEFQENRDKVEVYLAFGASRVEACRPIAIAALRLALTPTINSMSVLGIIAIPGMMTGAILGGSSVQQAARLQMIIIFMISSSTTLATIFTTFSCIAVIVDGKHRIRTDRIIDNSSSAILSKKGSAGSFHSGKEQGSRGGKGGCLKDKGFFGKLVWRIRGKSATREEDGANFATQGERRPLLA